MYLTIEQFAEIIQMSLTSAREIAKKLPRTVQPKRKILVHKGDVDSLHEHLPPQRKALVDTLDGKRRALSSQSRHYQQEGSAKTPKRNEEIKTALQARLETLKQQHNLP